MIPTYARRRFSSRSRASPWIPETGMRCSSNPMMKTTGNSSPFAAWTVKGVTPSASSGSSSRESSARRCRRLRRVAFCEASTSRSEQVPDVEVPRVHLDVAKASLEQRDLVSSVTDREPLRQSRSPVLLPQESGAEAVDSRHMELATSGALEVSNAALHLLCRLVREGDRKNGCRGDPLLNEPGAATWDDAGLPRPSTRENDFLPIRVDDSLSLRRVQSGQVEHGGAASCQERDSASSP